MAKWIRLLALLAILPLIVGGTCQSPTQDFNYTSLKNRCKGNFRLQSGDVIRVHVWNEPNHSRDSVLVRPDGMISLPLIGDLRAAELSISQLTDLVRQKVQTFVPNPRVDIALINARSYQIFIMGEVRNPGTFNPSSSVNVVQALSLAGGFTAFAKKDKIQIIWVSDKGEVRIPFNYEEELKGDNPEQNLVLCRGDTLLVP